MRQSDFTEYDSAGEGSEQYDDKRDDADGYKDPETLRNLYYQEQMSLGDIAQHFGVSDSTAFSHMEKNDIERWPVPESVYSQWGRDHPSGYHNPEVLREMYHGDLMTVPEIASHFGWSRSVIERVMDKHQIKRRARAEARQLVYAREGNHPELTEEVLQKKYVEEGFAAQAIADWAGCSSDKVFNRLDEYGIEKRSKSKAAVVSCQKNPPSFSLHKGGYEVVRTTYDGHRDEVLIHRLAAVAWFGWDAVVGNVIHHKNSHKRDNRESNLEPMSNSEHSKHHWENGDMVLPSHSV